MPKPFSPPKLYRDSATLKLAAQINEFVRSKTNDASVANIALEAARVTLSFVPWPPASQESSERYQTSDEALPPSGSV